MILLEQWTSETMQYFHELLTTFMDYLYLTTDCMLQVYNSAGYKNIAQFHQLKERQYCLPFLVIACCKYK